MTPNAGRKGIEVNSISTAFGYDLRHECTEEILYRSKKITPEQAALLDEPNALLTSPLFFLKKCKSI
jgi:hypothetical protein